MYHYRHYAGKRSFYLYTTNVTELGENGNSLYRPTGIIGYCHPNQRENTVPLYRYKKHMDLGNGQQGVDHLYTTDANEIEVITPGKTGRNGYEYVGITCFVHKYEDVITQ